MKILYAKRRTSGSNLGPTPGRTGMIKRDVHTLLHRGGMKGNTCHNLGRAGTKLRQGHTQREGSSNTTDVGTEGATVV